MTLMKPPWKCCIPPKGRIDKVFSWFLQFTENVLSMFCPSNWCLTVWPVVQCLRDPLWVQDFFHPQYGVCRKMVYTPYTPPQNGKTGELGQDRLEVRWEAVMFLFNVVNLNVWLFLSVNLAKCVVEVVVIMFGLNEGDNWVCSILPVWRFCFRRHRILSWRFCRIDCSILSYTPSSRCSCFFLLKDLHHISLWRLDICECSFPSLSNSPWRSYGSCRRGHPWVSFWLMNGWCRCIYPTPWTTSQSNCHD